jgi:hypothetical protein
MRILDFMLSPVPPANKAMVRLHSGTKCHTKHYSVGSHISFVFPPHKQFLRMHIYQHGLLVKTTFLQAITLSQKHQHISGILAYFDYMTVSQTTDSQKSADSDITDKLW